MSEKPVVVRDRKEDECERRSDGFSSKDCFRQGERGDVVSLPPEQGPTPTLPALTGGGPRRTPDPLGRPGAVFLTPLKDRIVLSPSKPPGVCVRGEGRAGGKRGG